MIGRLLAATHPSLRPLPQAGSRRVRRGQTMLEFGAAQRSRFLAVRRGQTMVEFAMVAPLLFLILFGFFYLGAQAFNRQTMRHAAEIGSAELNESLVPVSLQFANNSQLTTAFLDWNTSAVAPCRRARNDTDSPDYRRRMAWDWGGCASFANARAAVVDAHDQTVARIRSPGFFIGNPNNVQVQVCLVVVDRGGALRCVYSYGAGIVPVQDPASYGYYAPSFIQITLRAPGPFTIFGWNPGTQVASGMRGLDRFLAPCPAPGGSNNTFDYGLNGCGGQR